MRAVPVRVAVPFLLAGLGVVLMSGIVVAELGGPIAVLAYAAVIVGPVALAAARARRRRARLTAGRTCACCTGTVHDPVQVV